MSSVKAVVATLFLMGLFAPHSQAANQKADFWSQFFADQHSVEAIKGALQAPIPQEYIVQAREADDSLLTENDFDGTKAYLVTDAKLEKVEALTGKLLTAMGEDPSAWVIRLLDTDPPIQNAFVTGGKYIYVFTGLAEAAQSEDELAFVLGHEIGHSMLKHAYRQAQSWEGKLGAIAEALASRSKSAQAASAALASTYSQDDEREADALGTVIARKAGFNPLRGADFFSRSLRQEDREQVARAEQLQAMRTDAVNAVSACEQFHKTYGGCSAMKYALTDCAEKLNALCTDGENKRVAYNNALAVENQNAQSRSLSEAVSTHPPDQQRVASIAALSDVLSGKRDVGSLGKYAQAQRVMTVLTQVSSPLLKAPPAPAKAAQKPKESDQGPEARLEKLNALRAKGLITGEEYEKKRKEILDSM